MTPDLKYLACTAILTAALWIPYVIAQVMSKHAPPVDATFGAMLKRSLSLRPH